MEVLTHRGGGRGHPHVHDDAPMDLSVATEGAREEPYMLWQKHTNLHDLHTLPHGTSVFTSPESPSSSAPSLSPSLSSPTSPPSQRGGSEPKKRYHQDCSSPKTCVSPSTLSSPQPEDSPQHSSKSNKRLKVDPSVYSNVPSTTQSKKATMHQELSNTDVHLSTWATGGEGRRPGVIKGPCKEGHDHTLLESQRSSRSDSKSTLPVPSLLPLSPSPLLGLGIANMGEDYPQLLSNILQMQANQPDLSGAFPSTAIKDPEVILKAMQQSQMLYYSYCTQLIQTLREKQEQALRLEARHQEDRQRDTPQKEARHCEPKYQDSLSHEVHQEDLHFQENSQHHSQRTLHQNEYFMHQKSPIHSLKVESDEEDLQVDDYNSDHEENQMHSRHSLPEFFRTRLDSQESSSQSQSPPSPLSPSGMGFSYPKFSSSTPTMSDLLDDDLSQEVSHGSGALGRRRAPRALTGKHVRTGTGASTNTLLTLKQKLQQKLQNPEFEDSSRK